MRTHLLKEVGLVHRPFYYVVFFLCVYAPERQPSEELGIKRRSIEARKGDTVKVMAGDSKGKSGKITDVNLKTGKIMVDGIVRKNSKNKELQIAIYASNTYLTDIDLSDKLRKAEIEGIKAKK